METKKLIRMANQIGDFYAANPDQEAGKAGIASHLKKFWNSVMLNAIVKHVNEEGAEDLSPQVAEAIKQHLA